MRGGSRWKLALCPHLSSLDARDGDGVALGREDVVGRCNLLHPAARERRIGSGILVRGGADDEDGLGGHDCKKMKEAESRSRAWHELPLRYGISLVGISTHAWTARM